LAPYPERNPNAFSGNPRRMKPPRRRSLTLASQQKSFLCFSFARAGCLLLKGKECFAWLCSDRAGRWGWPLLYLLGRLGIPPPNPLLPSRPRVGGRIFWRRQIEILPLPHPPGARASWWNSLEEYQYRKIILYRTILQ